MLGMCGTSIKMSLKVLWSIKHNDNNNENHSIHLWRRKKGFSKESKTKLRLWEPTRSLIIFGSLHYILMIFYYYLSSIILVSTTLKNNVYSGLPWPRSYMAVELAHMAITSSAVSSYHIILAECTRYNIIDFVLFFIIC